MFGNYRQVFSQRSYASFWLSFTFSALGDAMTRVALTWLVYKTTHSAEALGWLMACYTGPVVVGGLLAGSLLDRFDRRKVMVVDNLVRGAAVALIPFLDATGHLALWHVYAVAAAYGLLMMISLAGGPALIPALVRQEQLSTANALETLSYTLAGVLGPVLAGWLVARTGAANVVVVDALSYFVFAGALARLRPPAPQAPAESAGPAHNFGDAVRLLLRDRILFSTTVMYMVVNIGAGFLAVWLPILSDGIPGGGSELFGALLGASAVGEVVSSVLAGSLTFPLSLGVLICAAVVLSGLSLVPLVFSTQAWVLALTLFLFGLFSAPLTIWAQTLRMKIIPERLRGRTFALLRMLMQSGGPLGSAIAGQCLPLLGVPAMIALSAVLVGAPGLAGFQVRDLRRAGAVDSPPAGEPLGEP